ncbi:hypothetical protein D3C86_1109550 [compost metagenome]
MAKKSQPKPTSDSTEKKKKEYKLDLYGQTLPALYKCDMDFYSRCTAEEQKEISPFVLMRMISLAKGYETVAPEFINQFVNNGYNRLYKHHEELQWKLLCVVAAEISPNRVPYHHRMFTPKKKVSKTPLLDAYFIQKYPLVGDNELIILRDKLSGEDEVRSMAEEFGADDTEIKNVVKEYRDNYGKKA